MRERLGKVAECVSSLRIYLLSEEPEIVCIGVGPNEGVVSFFQASAPSCQEVHVPEATDPKGALAHREASLLSVQEARSRRKALTDPSSSLLHSARGWLVKPV